MLICSRCRGVAAIAAHACPHACGVAAELATRSGTGGVDRAAGAYGDGLVVPGLALGVGLAAELVVEHRRPSFARGLAAEVGAEQRGQVLGERAGGDPRARGPVERSRAAPPWSC